MASLGALTLPADPVWRDEFPPDWSAVEQREDYGLTGALIVQMGVRQKGRPITLDVGWLSRADLLTLYGLAEAANVSYSLVIPQGTFTVRFRRPPLDVTPIREISDPASTDLYAVVLNLLEA